MYFLKRENNSLQCKPNKQKIKTKAKEEVVCGSIECLYTEPLYIKEFPRIIKFNKEILTNFNEAVNERLKC